MRERKFDKDTQTSFAKNHSVLGSKCLLTDIDVIQVTENKFYNQYWYQNGNPILRRFIEVKYKLTDYIKKQISKQENLNSQTKIFSYLVYELNQYRKTNSLPLAEFYFVIQTEGELPYYVFNVVGINDDLKFNYVSKVNDIKEFKESFNY